MKIEGLHSEPSLKAEVCNFQHKEPGFLSRKTGPCVRSFSKLDGGVPVKIVMRSFNNKSERIRHIVRCAIHHFGQFADTYKLAVMLKNILLNERD